MCKIISCEEIASLLPPFLRLCSTVLYTEHSNRFAIVPFDPFSCANNDKISLRCRAEALDWERIGIHL